MANVKVPSTKEKVRMRRASSPEDRENQMIARAYDLVEERLINGTATSQETTHFLKLGSVKSRLELEKLKRENELLEAKTKALQDAEDLKALYADAIKAMSIYQGHKNSDEEDYSDANVL